MTTNLTQVKLPNQKTYDRAVLLTSYEQTDVGNAERFVALHGKNFRYSYTWKKWLIWDGTRWAVDSSGAIRRLVKDMVRKYQKEVDEIEHEKTRRETMTYALKLESDIKIRAIINLSQSEEGVAIQPDELDRHKYLLNCTNGTIDLKTGELLPHNRDHLITKIAPVEYDPAAKCPMWLAHLDKIMADNQELILFLQILFGYCLTGDTSERMIAIFWGGGANGKSITLIIIAWILGDYASRMTTDTLLTRRQDGIPNDVARLKGARLAHASEAEQGRKLAEAKIKDMTGGEKIAARFLHGEFFEFVPEFKIILGTNHKPKIKGTDQAIWDRIRLVPFNVRIPENERIGHEEMKEMFEPEMPGILAWMVQGCLLWQKEGLGNPDDVKDATSSYRAEMDILGDFIEDSCNTGKEQFTSTKKDLYEHYKIWAESNGEQAVTQRVFGSMLMERGFDEHRTGKVRSWMGIAPK